jgi:hypothetical protein
VHPVRRLRTPVTPLPRDWGGLTAVVIGNGPSMLDHSWKARLAAWQGVRGYKLLVSNGGYKLFPFADVLMCSDRHWLAANTAAPNSLAGFLGAEITVTRPEAVVWKDYRMRVTDKAFIEKVHPRDIFADPRVLVEGHNSTSTNISQAVLRGAERIILVGVDLTPGPGNRRRTYDESTDDPALAAVRYERQVRHLTLQAGHVLARGVKVWNASPRSALKCYHYIKPDEVI